MHRIRRYGPVLQRQHLQRLWHRRGFVGLAIDLHPAKHQTGLGREGLDQMHRRARRSSAEGTPQRLALNGDDIVIKHRALLATSRSSTACTSAGSSALNKLEQPSSLGMPCSNCMKPRKNGSFFRPNRALTVQPSPPHTVESSPIINVSSSRLRVA